MGGQGSYRIGDLASGKLSYTTHWQALSHIPRAWFPQHPRVLCSDSTVSVHTC